MKTPERSVEEIVNEVIISVGRTGDVEGEIAKALQAERQRCDEVVELGKREQVEYIENMRDHDSCECDNCHRWRKFEKNWDKKCKRLDAHHNNPK